MRHNLSRSSEQVAWITGILLFHSCLYCQGWNPSRLLSRTAHHRALLTPRVSEVPPTNARSSSGFLSRNTKRLRSMVVGRRRISSSSSTSQEDELDLSSLQSENSLLRDTIRQLEDENTRLRHRADRMLGLENFEGDRFFRDDTADDLTSSSSDTTSSSSSTTSGGGITLSADEIANEELWCDTLDAAGERYFTTTNFSS